MSLHYVTDDERAEMVRLYGQGLSLRDVARRLNRTHPCVRYQLLLVAGVKLRPSGRPHKAVTS